VSEAPNRQPNDFLLSEGVDARDETIAQLEDRLEAQKDVHLEERFLWLLGIVILLDAYIFTQMSNWAGAVVIGLLQMIGLVIFAERCGINSLLPLLDRLFGSFRYFRGLSGD